MPWGALLSAGVGLFGANKAANAQQKGADAATAEQQRQYDLNRSDNLPALDARNNALLQMQSLAGKYGAAPTAADVMGQPGYQFGLQQGQNSLQSGAAAAGGLYSGAAGKALLKYGNDYATTKYDNALNNMRNMQNDEFNRYASISGQGQLGANAINSAGQNMANQNAGAYMSNGNAQGAASLVQGNILQNAINKGTSWWNQQPSWQPMNTGPTANSFGGANNMGFGTGGAYGYQDQGQYFADGGAVRTEPVIGTTSPIPGAGQGGGGLSTNALIAMLQSKLLGMGPVAPQMPGAAPLTAPVQVNPLNQRAVLDARMRAAGLADGGAVYGPGGPRDDAIPARLSNGEHIIDVASVDAIGGGNNDVGQQRLNQLRMMLKGAR